MTLLFAVGMISRNRNCCHFFLIKKLFAGLTESSFMHTINNAAFSSAECNYYESCRKSSSITRGKLHKVYQFI